MEGRLRLISNQVAYSTLEVRLLSPQKEVVVAAESFSTRLKEGFKSGWELAQGLIIGVITIWPLLLLCIAIVLLIRRYSKRRPGPVTGKNG
ncbi:MAG: DUF4349 domain-containing protein [Cyclobacteriaceae bacterium]